MSTSFSYELTYEAPLTDVAAMLSDPEFRKAVCDGQRALSRSVTVTGTTKSGSVSIEYSQAATGVPSFAKKIVGETLDIVQNEQWDDNRAALEIAIPGKPGHTKGTITLAESGGVTVERIALE